MKKIILLIALLTFQFMLSQEEKEKLTKFTLEYDMMRYTDISSPKENWESTSIEVSFNKTGNGIINFKSENGFLLELKQLTEAIKLINEKSNNREYLLSVLNDDKGNEYELELYLDEKADLLLYVKTEKGYTHAYQFLKRKYYEN